MKSLFFTAFLSCMLFLQANTSFAAEGFNIIVPYASGGSGDQTARVLAAELEKIVDGRIIVINKPGASSEIGTYELKASRPNGKVTGLLSSNEFTISCNIHSEPEYTFDDFQYLAAFTQSASGIYLKPNSPFKNIKEFIEFAKANPGRVTVSTSGISHEISIARLGALTGAKFNIVKYGSGGESTAALMGGHVDAAITDKRFYKTMSEANCPLVAVAADERYSALPDVPTFIENGYNLTDYVYRFLAIPAKVSPKKKAEIIEVLTQMAEMNNFAEQIKKLGDDPVFIVGDELTAIIKEQDTVVKNLFAQYPEMKKD